MDLECKITWASFSNQKPPSVTINGEWTVVGETSSLDVNSLSHTVAKKVSALGSYKAKLFHADGTEIKGQIPTSGRFSATLA